MATKNHKHLNSLHSDEHDLEEYRKRVATWADGNSVGYEDADFSSGDSPIVCDILSDLGRTAHHGNVTNDGPGNILVELSYDGNTYGSQHTLEGGEALSLDNLKVKKIRLTYVDDTAYRIFAA